VISVGRIAASVPLGFLIGLSLGSLGGGGSILAVPALVYGAGESAHAATTTSLVVVGATALAGMAGHLRAGRVRFWSGLGFGLVGIAGSFLGSLLNRDVPGDVLLLAFSGLIVAAAWRMRRRQAGTPRRAGGGRHDRTPGRPPAGPPTRAGEEGAQPAAAAPAAMAPRRLPARAGTVLRMVIAGSAVGFLTGLFGVGGGFVIVPALVLALGYEMPVAVGTSLLVIAVSSAEGLAFRLEGGGVDWRVAIPFTVAGITGVLLGTRIAGRVPAATLTRWFTWLLIAVAAYTAARSLAAL